MTIYVPKEGRQLITPAIAEYIGMNFRMDNQRKVNEAHAVSLMKKIKSGTFTGGTIELGHLDGKWYLLDGQHRLLAIKKADKSVEMNVAFYMAKDKDDLVRRFSVIDNGALVRRDKDVMKAHGVTDKFGFNHAQASLVYRTSLLAHAKLNIWKKNKHPEIEDTEERVAWAEDWAPYASSIFTMMKESGAKDVSSMIRSPKVFALAMILMRSSPERAEEFWYGVLSADGLKSTDPVRVLHDWFLKASGNNIDQDIKMLYAISAWNLFFDGKKEVKSLQPKFGAVKIKGTTITVGEKNERNANSLLDCEQKVLEVRKEQG